MLSRRRGLCGKRFIKCFVNPVYSTFEIAEIGIYLAT